MVQRTLVIERELDAPRALVWTAWTDPDQIAQWWGPEGFHSPREKIEIDLREGGICSIPMVGPDGVDYPNVGVFREVVPGEKLVWGEDETCHPMIESAWTTIEFADAPAGRTKVTITSRMVCVNELIPMARQGWGEQLDKLERKLSAAER